MHGCVLFIQFLDQLTQLVREEIHVIDVFFDQIRGISHSQGDIFKYDELLGDCDDGQNGLTEPLDGHDGFLSLPSLPWLKLEKRRLFFVLSIGMLNFHNFKDSEYV